jgi:hypothetical protein
MPGSTDAAFPVKTERLPPTGFPPLRHGAEALLTAHSMRIGDRTGNEVAIRRPQNPKGHTMIKTQTPKRPTPRVYAVTKNGDKSF